MEAPTIPPPTTPIRRGAPSALRPEASADNATPEKTWKKRRRSMIVTEAERKR
jgi:hypothetical protein